MYTFRMITTKISLNFNFFRYADHNKYIKQYSKKEICINGPEETVYIISATFFFTFHTFLVYFKLLRQVKVEKVKKKLVIES